MHEDIIGKKIALIQGVSINLSAKWIPLSPSSCLGERLHEAVQDAKALTKG